MTYKTGNCNVLHATVESIKIVKAVYWNNEVLNGQQKTAIKSNPYSCRYLNYILVVKNISKNGNVSNIYIWSFLDILKI